MEEMREEERKEQAEGRLSVLNLFTFRPLRWQLISIMVLMAGQQLSGINAVRAGPPLPESGSPWVFFKGIHKRLKSNILHFDACETQSDLQEG